MGDDEDTTVAFRSSKKRKVIRQRNHIDDDTSTTDNEALLAFAGSHNAVDDRDVAANASKLQQAVRSRGGVAFSSQKNLSRNAFHHESDSSRALVPSDPSSLLIAQATGRFVSGIGQAVLHNTKDFLQKQEAPLTVRVAYVDSKLAEIRGQADSTPTTRATDRSSRKDTPEFDEGRSTRIEPESSTSRYHMVEEVPIVPSVDPGSDADRDGDPSTRRQKPPRPRFGRGGKLLPPRKPRGYRAEDDKARDSLVDRLLAENRLEGIYDTAGNSAGVTGDRGKDMDADRRMAEDFEKEYRTNAQDRQSRTKASAATKVAEPTTGPKLGGSKNNAARR